MCRRLGSPAPTVAVSVIDWPSRRVETRCDAGGGGGLRDRLRECCGRAGAEAAVSAIDGRDRVAADCQAAGGEGGLIDSVHDAERAGAQSIGAVHEGHGAGGVPVPELAGLTVAVKVIGWPAVAEMAVEREAGGRGSDGARAEVEVVDGAESRSSRCHRGFATN